MSFIQCFFMTYGIKIWPSLNQSVLRFRENFLPSRFGTCLVLTSILCFSNSLLVKHSESKYSALIGMLSIVSYNRMENTNRPQLCGGLVLKTLTYRYTLGVESMDNQAYTLVQIAQRCIVYNHFRYKLVHVPKVYDKQQCPFGEGYLMIYEG